MDVDWSLIKARNPVWNGLGLAMATDYTLSSTLPRFTDALCLVARQSMDVPQLPRTIGGRALAKRRQPVQGIVVEVEGLVERIGARRQPAGRAVGGGGHAGVGAGAGVAVAVDGVLGGEPSGVGERCQPIQRIMAPGGHAAQRIGEARQAVQRIVADGGEVQCRVLDGQEVAVGVPLVAGLIALAVEAGREQRYLAVVVKTLAGLEGQGVIGLPQLHRQHLAPGVTVGDHPLLAAAVDDPLQLIGRIVAILGDHAVRRGDEAKVARRVVAVARHRQIGAAHRLAVGQQPAPGVVRLDGGGLVQGIGEGAASHSWLRESGYTRCSSAF